MLTYIFRFDSGIEYSNVDCLVYTNSERDHRLTSWECEDREVLECCSMETCASEWVKWDGISERCDMAKLRVKK